MNRRATIVGVIFIFWVLLCTYYYVCIMHGYCIFGKKKAGVTVDEQPAAISNTSNLDHSKVWSVNSSSELLVGNRFFEEQEALISRMSELDTLLITGRYKQEESAGFSLAFGRAMSVKKLMKESLDSTRIKIDVMALDRTPSSQADTFEAVDFTLVKFDEVVVETPKPAVATPEGLQQRTTPTNKFVLFEPGGVVKRTSNDDIEDLRELAVDLIATSDKIYVIGHSYTLGDEEANYQLGRKRAWAVKKVLWDMGLDPNRIITDSKGSKSPANSSNLKDLRNERTDIHIGQIN